MSGPEITVVIPTYKRPHLLRRCLSSLAASNLPKSRFEVCVVDDGSGAETVAILEDIAASWPEMRWATQTNQGQAAARNQAVAMSRSALILFIDDDIVVPEALVAQHLEFHQAASGQDTGLIGRVAWHPDLEVTDFMRWLDSTPLQFNFEHMQAGPVDRPWEAFYTCNLSLPRRLVEDAGGFDERFRAFEDTELGYRLALRGFRLVYRPEVLAWHARGIALTEFARKMRLAGESGVLLRGAQPDLPLDIPSTSGPRPAWKSFAAGLLHMTAALSRSHKLRHRYYRHIVESAFGEGVAAAGARPDS